MSAPTAERTRTGRPAATAGSTTGSRNGSRNGTVPSPRDPGGAVGRAYARRAGRRQRLGGAGSPETEGRAQFVLMIMLMLGVGLVASLWLSTTAAADSYRLDTARQSTRELAERIETVHSQIVAMQSTPALARAARSLGMVQLTDVARLVVGPDGHVSVFGTPKAAMASAPPVAPMLPVVAGAPVPASGVAPVALPGQPAALAGAPVGPAVAQPPAPASGAVAQPPAPASGAVAQPGAVAEPTSGAPVAMGAPVVQRDGSTGGAGR
jgi:hypothetical protein